MAKKKQPRIRKVPLRSCIICHEKQEKRSLHRIVRTPEQTVVIDRTGKQNGRGAYLCSKVSCWDKVTEQPMILGKALNASISTEALAHIAANKPNVPQSNPV